ncbi:hypothetical protein [Saliniradius amylolyticus]|nr:hypothetical protein [Saliniradius amylolyticus]
MWVTATEAKPIPIFIRDDVYADYQKAVGDKPVLSVTNFSQRGMRRDVVDMIIAQQALKLGGFDYHFEYFPGKVNFRNTRMLKTGELLMSFDSYWLEDAQAINQHVYISKPVIRRGEYLAGIYTQPGNEATLAIKQLEDLHQLTSVSTPKWSVDWRTLNNLGLKELVREDSWVSQAQMVYRGWVDFMLSPFLPEQKNFVVNNVDNTGGSITLVAVPGVAVVLDGSRHYVISRNHPLGKAAYKALEEGLQVLRQDNRVRHAYQQAGFFVQNERVSILNAHLVQAKQGF